MPRPDCIRHFSEIQDPDDAHYPGSDELLSIGSPFGRRLGLQRIGIHHEVLPPGRRTSWPHAERDEEEFVYVIEGTPDLWLDGTLHRLAPGDGVGFPAGTGQAHCVLNNTGALVRLMVVGESHKPENKFHYPLHPERNRAIGERWWSDVPVRQMGAHDGVPDAQKNPPVTDDDCPF